MINNYFSKLELDKLLEIKELSVRQSAYYCRMSKGFIYKLIRNKDTGFPVLEKIDKLREHKIPAKELIEWRTKLANNQLTNKQKEAIRKLREH
jgi:hypothetical protein